MIGAMILSTVTATLMIMTVVTVTLMIMVVFISMVAATLTIMVMFKGVFPVIVNIMDKLDMVIGQVHGLGLGHHNIYIFQIFQSWLSYWPQFGP